MKIEYFSDHIKIKDCLNFSLYQTLECGQCFRFWKEGEDFRIVAGDKTLRASQSGDEIILFASKQDFDSFWCDYFDLARDYGEIADVVGKSSPFMKKAVEYGSGIRILNQSPWETMVSFIISQNNNIPRIKKIIESLCRLFGKPIANGLYSFPTAAAIREAGIEALAPIRSGFRAKYIYDAACKVADGEIVLEQLYNIGYDEARSVLKQVKGIGDKVADCVLLFGYRYTSAFPQDVWIKKAVESHFGSGFDSSIFGDYSGYAQQYLYWYERENASKKGVGKQIVEG